MKLQNPSPVYSRRDELERSRAIELADKQNHKRGRDVEIGASGERLILTDQVTGERRQISLRNGALVIGTV